MKLFFKVIYNLVASKLPCSDARFSFGAKKIRKFLVKRTILNMGSNVNIEKGAKFSDTLEIGDNSGVGINCELSGKVIIGNDVMMGPEVTMYTVNHYFERTDIPMWHQGFSKTKPIQIEDDVWIGGRVTILPGINIGKGSIIGAGAVVTKDVLPYSIVGGNPATMLKKRK